MINKILYNNLTTKKVDLFEANNFSIKFKPNWRQIRKFRNNNTLSFVNVKNDIGTLQISSFLNPEKNYNFDLNNSKSKVERNGFKPEIRDVSKYQSIFYGLNYVDENLYQFRFEFGNKNKRLLATLTFENNNKNIVEENYVKIVQILDTIIFME
ncbi:hypothetical protein [Tenacibaculum ovolyticum]|uniref:hypothetical protein n=1 Tax=Tenacibaculum ovolyticum TaxID=104270 RepID=UPI0007ECFDB8|nr:hypothetical protein [Tenacibaculum ovolyticum]